MSISGKDILSDREQLIHLLKRMLLAKIPKDSGRDKTLSEVHSSVCHLVRELSNSTFYVTTEFSPEEKHVAAKLMCRSRLNHCISVNIDTPGIAEPVDIDVWLCA